MQESWDCNINGLSHSDIIYLTYSQLLIRLVSPDGVAPSWMVIVSASVNLPLHHKVQKFSSGTGSPGWSRKKGRKAVVVVVVLIRLMSQKKVRKFMPNLVRNE